MHTALMGWIAAWRALAHNPLPGHWRTAERRRIEAAAWYSRAPGLLLCGVLCSAATCLLLVLALDEFLAVSGSALATRAAARGYLYAGTAALFTGALAFGLCWLIARSFVMARFALGLLSERQGPRDDASLDSLLALTSLSERDIVLAVARQALRLLAPPLLMVWAAQLLGLACAMLADAATVLGAAEIARPLLWALLLCSLQLLSALMAAVASALLLTILGRGARGAWRTMLGALGFALAQLCWLVLGTPLLFSTVNQGQALALHQLWPALAGCAAVPLLAWLAARQRRSSGWVLAALPLLIFSALALGCYGISGSGWSYYENYDNAPAEFSAAFAPLCLANPVATFDELVVMSSHNTTGGLVDIDAGFSTASHLYQQSGRLWCGYLLAQLCALLLLPGLAVLALKHWRGGTP